MVEKGISVQHSQVESRNDFLQATPVPMMSLGSYLEMKEN